MLHYGSQNSLDESSQKQIKWEPFKTQSHFAKIMDQINSFKKNDSFCDVTLVVEDKEIRAHKMILAACSKYFHIMFTSFKESKEDRITLQLISYEALNLIIDYIYTSEILINEYTVQILLPAANMLQITEVQNACCSFLNSALCDYNCIGIRTFADTHNCKELYDRSDAFIKRNFRFVTKHKEYLALSFEDFYEIISSNHLSVPNEVLVWDCVIEWVTFDKEKRMQYADRLIEAIRFPLLPMSHLLKEDFTEHDLFKDNPKVKDFIIEALRYVVRKDDSSLIYEMNELRFQPRKPLVSPAIILTIGGQSPKAIKSVEYYDFDEEKWTELPQMPSRRCRSGIAVVNQAVYLIGGFNSNARVRTVEKYDFVHARWTPCANMRVKRSTLGVATCDENVYAVGGFDGVMGLNSAEMYDSRTNLWQDIAKMIHRRSSVGVGALNGKIYAVGGYDGFFKTCLNSVECYDPSVNSWQFVSCMEFIRSGAGVGVLNDLLYAIGGHNGPTVWKTVEAYNSETNMWVQVADMNVRRRNVGVVTFNNSIYVIGGDDGKTNLDSMEVYSPDKNQWTLLSSKMITARSYAGVCVVDNVFGIFPHSFN